MQQMAGLVNFFRLKLHLLCSTAPWFRFPVEAEFTETYPRTIAHEIDCRMPIFTLLSKMNFLLKMVKFAT